MKTGARLGCFLLAAGLAVGLGLPACHRHSAPPPNSPAVLAETRTRLEGTWTLEKFQPERPLEPVLDSLLKAQLGVLTVEVKGEQLVARSAGLLVVRRLDVVESTGADFRVQLRDDQGVTYDVRGEFAQDRIQFTSMDDPWRGQGELRRVQ